jgi:alanyl-tRNA synthetase
MPSGVTEKLYHADPGLLSFNARVLLLTDRDGRGEVVLDRTCFYPGGGGQPGDTGTLGHARVVETAWRGEQIVHVVQPALPESALGSTVHGEVDAVRRRDFMVQHTGQHIFSQALVRAGKLETVSVHFGDDDTTVEVAADTVPDEVLREAEDIANTVIKENRRIILHEVDPSEAARFPLRRTPPDVGRLRVVEVEGYDWAACGGVHVASSGDVFLTKAVSQEKIRGRVRIHILMGRRAMDDYGRKVTLVQALSRVLTCGESSIESRVQEIVTREKESSRELHRLKAAQAGADADEAVHNAEMVGPGRLVVSVLADAGPDYLKAFAERVTASPGRIVVAVDRGADSYQWIVAHSLDGALELPALVQPLLEQAGAKGGGRGGRMQGTGAPAAKGESFAGAVKQALVDRLG